MEYYGDEEVTLSNYFKWINPVFALGTKPKPDPTLERVLIHLEECQNWLERAQTYPWYADYVLFFLCNDKKLKIIINKE